jgi:ParB-like chromosome segregation protein Spo0J
MVKGQQSEHALVLLAARLGEGASTAVPVTAIRGSYSPRLAGPSEDHVQVLAEVWARLPPIVLHRETMRIIDGTHRVLAAVRNGRDTVEARFFEGSEEQAFALAVKANINHGLPLSLSDRKGAAARMLTASVAWSDRYIAMLTGLSAGTVRTLRAGLVRPDAPAPVRVGRDGRVRPVDSSAQRTAAADLLRERPQASLREVAEATGLSPSTVRVVRQRMAAGADVDARTGQPAPRQRRLGYRTGELEQAVTPTATRSCTDILRGLKRDPSLRFSDTGRAVLRWLDGRATDLDRWEGMVPHIPPHCRYLIVELATACAGQWAELAVRLRTTSLPGGIEDGMAGQLPA